MGAGHSSDAITRRRAINKKRVLMLFGTASVSLAHA